MLKRTVWLVSLLLILFGVSLAQAESNLESLAAKLVASLAAEDFGAVVEKFDPTMKKCLPAPQLANVWKEVTTQYGPFEKQVAVRRETVQQYTAVFITGEFEKGVLDIKVVFDQQNEVAGLFILPSGLKPKE